MFDMGFPKDIQKAVLCAATHIPKSTYGNVKSGVTEEQLSYILGKQAISFPYRVYFLEIDDNILSRLSKQEQIILHCIYSRSCNGFVREKHIRALLSMNYPEWAIPYIVKVCDEYVVEILQAVYDSLKGQNTDIIKQFCATNRPSFCRSYNRMISYWNEFYRGNCYHYKNFIGRKLFIECFGASRTMKDIDRTV